MQADFSLPLTHEDANFRVIQTARKDLGKLWLLGRPLSVSEFRQILRLPSTYGDNFIQDLERGYCPVPGPISVAVELMLEGIKPKHYKDVFPASVQQEQPVPAVRSWRPDVSYSEVEALSDAHLTSRTRRD